MSIIDDLVPLNKMQQISIFVLIVFIFQFIFFYTPTLAKEQRKTYAPEIRIREITPIKSPKNIFTKIKIEDKEIVQKDIILSISVHLITAYNSETGQTDNSPCITANNFNVCNRGVEDTIAANFLKFGTKVKIPELFGDRVFIVRDRMNKRYPNRIDIWMKNKKDAMKFGSKIAKIEIIK